MNKMSYLRRTTLLTAFLLITPSLGKTQEADKSLFGAYETALVVYNRSSGTAINASPSLSARRVPPCSTFKIYNTLIGLELGLINKPDDPWYKWDGIIRNSDGWNRDLTLREAFRVSAVPAFQELARKIGSGRMQEYIELINYGTKDISSGIDSFWLPRQATPSIMISADEQVVLLNMLLDGKFPFSAKNRAVLRDIMQTAKTEKGTLYGKTGSAMNSDGEWYLGWFVGFLEHNGTTYVFACNITGGENPSGKTARQIVETFFKTQQML